MSTGESFLLKNAATIATLESALKTLSWILPGRFDDAELASESVASLVDIVSMYHDEAMGRVLKGLGPRAPGVRPSVHARFTGHYMGASKAYALCAKALSIIGYTELLVEMAVRKRRGGGGASQTTVVALEGIKAILRLALFTITHRRPLVTPVIPERVVEPHELTKLVAESSQEQTPPPLDDLASSGSSYPPEPPATEGLFYRGAKSGLTKPTLRSLRRNASALSDAARVPELVSHRHRLETFLTDRVLTPEDVKRPQELVNVSRGLYKFSEVVWILRPLIYAALVRKYGRKHSLPFLLSLSVEYLSYSLRRSAQSRLKTVSQLEIDETKHRQNAFAWYLLRGPVWDGWTKPRLEGVASALENKPILDIGATLLRDYIPLIDEYFYYSS